MAVTCRVFDSPEEGRAYILLSRFRRWANANPDVLRWMWRTVRNWAIEGKRSSTKRLFEIARYDSGIRIIDVDGEVKIRNDYSPIIARIMAKSIPGADKVFVIKKSDFDLLDEAQVPRFDEWGTLIWGENS